MRATTPWLTLLGAMAALACTGISDPITPPQPGTPQQPEGPDTRPGALEISVAVEGTPAPSISYAVVVTTGRLTEPQRHTLPDTGGSVLIPELSSGTRLVRLESPDPCWIVSPNPAFVLVRSNQTSQLGFKVTCGGPPNVVYDRTSPYPPGMESWWTRYVFEPGGTFRLQYRGGTFGFFEYLGTSVREGDRYGLTFNQTRGPEWVATATLQGSCITVSYNINMMLSDFDDATFCTNSSE